MLRKPILFLVLILVLLLIPAGALAQEQPAVHAVLFYSPTCPHCHEVLQNGLPPLMEKYGDQLQIILVDVSSQGGQLLYRAAVDWLPIPQEKGGVPALIVGRTLLIGSEEIPERLPGIVEAGLAKGGIDWPEIPGLAEVIVQMDARDAAAEAEAAIPEVAANAPVTPAESEPVTQVIDSDSANPSALSATERFMLDPTGSVLALILLLGMIASVILLIRSWRRGRPLLKVGGWTAWIIPALALVGLAVAAYLAYVETTQTAAVCGPVGDCNTVQQSAYATLFGVLPIGVLGAFGYLVILALWFWQRYGPADSTRRTGWLLPAAALAGVLFSIYLTFLEPFVIGAVCIWCLTSALIMTLLLWLAVGWILGRNQGPARPIAAR